MAAKKIDYWEKRRQLEDEARLQMENEMLKKLTSIYPEALKNIQDKLLSQADLRNISINDLLSDYSNRNQEKYRKYIENNYQDLMNSNEKYNEFINEFFPAYDYAKVNRLLQIRSDIFKELAQQTIGNDANRIFNNGLEDIFTRCYTSNSNVFAQLGLAGPYGVTKEEMENYLNYPWSGKTFSNRLWGNISRLEQNLSQSIVNAVASGEGVEDALKRMRNNSAISDMFKLESDKFSRAIENLVRTEYAHFAVTGLNKSLDDAGLKNKVAWSAEDERVCSICGERHGKLIKDDWFPPYHSRCRCTVMPKMDDLGKDIDQLYDEMFGNLLDEFAADKFGIKLNHPDSKKYNKDEGYFNFNLTDHKLSRNEAIRRLQEEFGMEIIETSRTRLSEVALNQTYGVLDGFKDLYNVLPEKIPQVRALTKSKARDTIAWYSRNGRTSTPVEFGINVAYFKTDGILRNITERNVDNGWFSKNKKPNHIMIHEFAHHIDFQLTKLLNESFSDAVFSKMTSNYEDVYDLKTIANDVGGYAKSYYGSKKSHVETFAEIFAEAYGESPRKIAEDFRKEFEKLAEEVIKNAGLT